ncbi:MAG TPA: hypothetical protein VFZ56_11845 [Gemmatimonadaceae bacterium]
MTRFMIPAALAASLQFTAASAQAPAEPLVFGVFIASIEEGARVFTPTRLLPFEHADAFNHEFPTALVNHTTEVDAIVHLGELAGLRLRTTLLRYPRPPVEEWPYPEFAPPPLECIRAADVERAGSRAVLPGLRALVVRDGKPLVFIVDTRGLTLEQRGMQRVTSMGLDLTRAQFLERLAASIPAGRDSGCRIVIYPGVWGS